MSIYSHCESAHDIGEDRRDLIMINIIQLDSTQIFKLLAVLLLLLFLLLLLLPDRDECGHSQEGINHQRA